MTPTSASARPTRSVIGRRLGTPHDTGPAAPLGRGSSLRSDSTAMPAPCPRTLAWPAPPARAPSGQGPRGLLPARSPCPGAAAEHDAEAEDEAEVVPVAVVVHLIEVD